MKHTPDPRGKQPPSYLCPHFENFPNFWSIQNFCPTPPLQVGLEPKVKTPTTLTPRPSPPLQLGNLTSCYPYTLPPLQLPTLCLHPYTFPPLQLATHRSHPYTLPPLQLASHRLHPPRSHPYTSHPPLPLPPASAASNQSPKSLHTLRGPTPCYYLTPLSSNLSPRCFL
ncbi:hypothetical protein PtA15_16A160 [Puccinia triticina]|uniref:Uncharacterized protein n=1 Tax=Puccinia triticina TaxID=208348 RepID=A0ABY7D3R8_9BASI|nr:uncharacterized protein PtA15_16A160 [Puccinia triticina]WAQ92254.1 hypothetical protein PtA15_16A160 [Puccinia triticina]